MKKITIYSSLITVLALVLSFMACRRLSSDGLSEDKITIERFDKLMSDYITLNSFSSLQKMKTEFAEETKLLEEEILCIGQVTEENIDKRLVAYFEKEPNKQVMKEALAKFEYVEEIEASLTHSFNRLVNEIPSLKIPRIYAQISGLNESVVVTESSLGFSTDKYMGADYPIYKKYYYPYQRKTMSEEFIVPDCLFYFLFSESSLSSNGAHNTFMDFMLYYAKLYYIISKVTDRSIEDLLAYSKKEVHWCKENEKKLWKDIISHNYLQSTDPYIIRTYCKNSPFTSFYGEESPSRLGMWMGYQIVTKYVKKHNVSLALLFEQQDYRAILAGAQYKP
jgi:hypothetical protein